MENIEKREGDHGGEKKRKKSKKMTPMDQERGLAGGEIRRG